MDVENVEKLVDHFRDAMSFRIQSATKAGRADEAILTTAILAEFNTFVDMARDFSPKKV